MSVEDEVAVGARRNVEEVMRLRKGEGGLATVGTHEQDVAIMTGEQDLAGGAGGDAVIRSFAGGELAELRWVAGRRYPNIGEARVLDAGERFGVAGDVEIAAVVREVVGKAVQLAARVVDRPELCTTSSTSEMI